MKESPSKLKFLRENSEATKAEKNDSYQQSFATSIDIHIGSAAWGIADDEVFVNTEI